MANDDYYVQCKLKKENAEEVAFIPLKFASKNKELQIKKNDEWEDGWKVFEVYSNSKCTKDVALKAESEHRKYGTQLIAGRPSRKDLD